MFVEYFADTVVNKGRLFRYFLMGGKNLLLINQEILIKLSKVLKGE